MNRNKLTEVENRLVVTKGEVGRKEEKKGGREKGRERERVHARGRGRERESALAPPFICFFLHLGLPYANWA